MAKKSKFYVVWKGKKSGIFTDWKSCKAQIDGYKGAQYKSFESFNQAKIAFSRTAKDYIDYSKKSKTPDPQHSQKALYLELSDEIILKNAIAVDAACSGNPGKMEYQGVEVKSKKRLFHQGVFKQGTNNVGEFLALVHGLAFLQYQEEIFTIYSDSKIAISWVKQKKCKTKLKKTTINEPLFELIKRAEYWLENNTYKTRILKWETKQWGEIPADFNRK